MNELIAQFKKNGIDNVIQNEPLKNHTTWKIGGPAKLFFEPSSVKELQEGLAEIKKRSIPWFALGRGSNVLVADEGLDGVVIKLGDGLAQLDQQDELFTVGSGYSLIKLATIVSKKGYSGLEFAGGIPGSVGGAVFMNAGAHNADISTILTKALILMPDGELYWINRDDLGFNYRTSNLHQNGGICIAAQFCLEKGNTVEIRKRLQKNKAYRKNTQPWNDPCCGSVFRNPLPLYAGEIIENLGLKGEAVGGAQVSEKHANFIINAGGATANDVLTLIKKIQDLALNRYGVEMKTEVEYVGEK
ncbi:UDP-N-acetylmuramate dehydrogenase [Salipaludibacillus sp. HK11]|uniref:UDP-N-acetylmuramate dehydrogenase n=1 Tax=Salipaludibacillus sp. HK11 TaxID=3394320 RepID=UPI0039FC403F